MGWVLVGSEIEGEFPLRAHQQLSLIVRDACLVPVDARPADASLVLGVLNPGVWNARLSAVSDALQITPSQPKEDASCDPPTEEYTLYPIAEGHSETIILRDGDKISSKRAPFGLVLTWKPPQVQVNSSVAAEGEILAPKEPKIQNDIANFEEKTEDDEDLDNTVFRRAASSGVPDFSRCTPPLPSASRTEVIKETPTAVRISRVVQPLSRKNARVNGKTPPKEPTSPTVVAENRHAEDTAEMPADVEMINDDDSPIQPSGRHPKMHIPKKHAKRASPGMEEEEIKSPASRSTKRRKVDADDMTVPVQRYSHHKKLTKVEKPLSDVQQEQTPPKMQRSSPRSATATAAAAEGEYEAPTNPRVAFSNSSIQPNSNFVKFLKKHGGWNIESIKDGCDILCVKDGSLVKTMKLLQSVALGIPIVSDRWLMDSAKATKFLPLKQYIPNVPIQEKDWNFSLSSIWSIPQVYLFKGYTIRFTDAVRKTYKDFGEMEQVCKAVGARRVVSGKKAGGKELDGEDMIVIGAEEGDTDAEKLIESGKACFSKDFLTNSILRGAIDLESEEFRISPKATDQGKKGRKRKS